MSHPTRPRLARRAARRPVGRALLAFALAAVVAVPALVLADSGPAFAAGSVTPSKSTGVAATGETLTFNGSGFDSSRGIYAQFCKQVGTSGTSAGRATGGDCAATQFWITGPGVGVPAQGTTAWTGDGTFSVSFSVAAAFKEIDCRATGVVCGLQTRNDHREPGVYDQDTFTPITFAADPPNPAVALSKATDVAPTGETITVDGTGFDSARGIYAQFCKQVGTSGTSAGRASGPDCAPTQFWITGPGAGVPAQGTTAWTGTGTFQISFPVASTFKEIDCRATGVVCGIQTRNDHREPGVYDQDSFTPIAFAADAPTGPTVTVNPTTGLDAAGDTVTVSGVNIPEGQGVYIRLCKAPTGQVGTAAGRPAAGDCDGQGLWASPAPPDPALPVITDGGFTAALPVAGAFAGDPANVDCMTDGSCGVFIRRDHVGGGNDFALDSFTPISFDASTTPPVIEEPEEPSLNDVTVTLSQSEGLLDNQVITVSGEDFVAKQGVYVQFCATPTGQLGTAAGRATSCYPEQDGTHTVWVSNVADDGTFRTPLTVVSTFTPEGQDPVDCTVDGTCGVFIRRDHNGGTADYSQDAFVPVTFGDGSVEPGPDPTIGASKTTDLDPAGDTVTVEGADFQPGTELFVALCDANVANFAACDFDNVQEVTAAPNPSADKALGDPGTFAVDLEVRAAFGDVDCLAEGSACAIQTWAVSGGDGSEEVTLPVSFAGGTTTTTVDPGTTPDAGTTGTGSLPRTGAGTAGLVIAGLLALGVGTAMLTTARRRQAATS
ncbi:MAG TPA: neocarzinostatin apoprotein domain-containing protein [Acidimicrobiales bacterium]|nr:neocarzinostatin apoprotein domain-containing protein [Acidimicrobiales bacterium]